MNNSTIDDDLKERIKEKYEHETGHELPDHVAENLSVLHPHTVDRIEMKRHEPDPGMIDSDDGVHPAKLFLFFGVLAGSGLIGIISTRLFQSIATQILGGFFVSVLSFSAIMIGLWALSDK